MNDATRTKLLEALHHYLPTDLHENAYILAAEACKQIIAQNAPCKHRFPRLDEDGQRCEFCGIHIDEYLARA